MTSVAAVAGTVGLLVMAAAVVAQEAPTGFELPNSAEIYGISTSSPCSDDEEEALAASGVGASDVKGLLYNVYASARNAGRDDPDSHIYLYGPSLRFELKEGQVRVDENDQGVAVYLEGAVGNRTRDRILKCLAYELDRPLARAQLRPLQFRYILLKDATSDWRSAVPLDVGTIPQATRRFHRFEFPRLRSDMDPGQFADRLRSGEVVFNVELSYSGHIGTESSVEIVKSDLLDTDFVRDLAGDGSAELVTRNQLEEAGVQAFQQIRRTTYRERDLEPPARDWLYDIWTKETIRWGEFLDERLGDLSRYGFDEDDLSPDKLTDFLKHVNEQLEDETKDSIEIDASFKAEAGFFGIGGGVEGSFSLAKSEFRKRIESSDHRVEWTGEQYIPRDIAVYVINENDLALDQQIYDRVVLNEGAEAAFSYQLEVVLAEESPSSVEMLEQVGDAQRWIEERLVALETAEEMRVQVGSVALSYSHVERPVAGVNADGLTQRGIVNGRVDFPVGFSSVPAVHLALTAIDMLGDPNGRIAAQVTSVDEKGFNYNLFSWWDTHVYTATASWIAVGK